MEDRGCHLGLHSRTKMFWVSGRQNGFPKSTFGGFCSPENIHRSQLASGSRRNPDLRDSCVNHDCKAQVTKKKEAVGAVSLSTYADVCLNCPEAKNERRICHMCSLGTHG